MTRDLSSSAVLHEPEVDLQAAAPERAALTVRDRWLIAAFWFLALALGAVAAWVFRHNMGSDGISYLDIADAYREGDWRNAINGYWSPLYSWVLALAFAVYTPAPYWEFPFVKLVNFFVYTGALACFHFFLLEILKWCRRQRDTSGGAGALPAWTWITLGFSLFIWTSLRLITIDSVTPDMCASAVVYIAAGLLLKIRRGAGSAGVFVLLGVVLGFGYLAKAAMLPLGFLFLASAAVAAGGIRTHVRRLILSLGAFLVVAAPFVVALSLTKGRFTFGDSGKLNYGWWVSGLPFNDWRGDPPGSGTPLHLPRKLLDHPLVYEFGSPVRGTNPLWYDPSYWQEGMAPPWSWRGQVRVAWHAAESYFAILFRSHGGLLAVLMVLLLNAGSAPDRSRRVAALVLLIPALGGLALYALVHLELRFVGPVVALIWMALYLLADTRSHHPRDSSVRGAGSVVTIIMVLLLVELSGRLAGGKSLHLTANWVTPMTDSHWQVASALADHGIQPGDKVASVGGIGTAYWARLLRVRLAAEVHWAPGFWSSAPEAQRRAIAACRTSRAKVIVSSSIPTWANGTGWRRLGTTDHFGYFF